MSRISDKLIQQIRDYYAKPGNSVGGSLHIVLEDGNIKDHHVEFCLDYATDKGDTEGANLAARLLKLSKTQRKKLYRMEFYP